MKGTSEVNPMSRSVTYGIPVYPVDARWHKTE
jgi:hypothetical protein